MPNRYHALDSLRSAMMLLGVALHISITYAVTPMAFWPMKDASAALGYDFFIVNVHIFRMPVFFVMAGFFANLLFEKRGMAGFLVNRFKRVVLPLIILWPPLSMATFFGVYWFGVRTQPDGLNRAINAVISGKWLDRGLIGHLWFLYYLIFLYIGLVLILGIPKRSSGIYSNLVGLFKKVMTTPVRIIVFTIPTYAGLRLMEKGPLETPLWFLPLNWKLIASYLFFAIFGWLLYECSDLLASFTSTAWLNTALALLLGFLTVGGMGRYAASLRGAAGRPPAFYHEFTAICAALSCWLFIFGLIGLAQKYLSTPRRWARYLSDASYWIYLFHVPLVIAFSVLLLPIKAPSLIKVGINLVTSTAILVASYELLGRRTPLAPSGAKRWRETVG